jgi:hypothetical protein
VLKTCVTTILLLLSEYVTQSGMTQAEPYIGRWQVSNFQIAIWHLRDQAPTVIGPIHGTGYNKENKAYSNKQNIKCNTTNIK